MAEERAGTWKTLLSGMAQTPWLRQLLIMVAIAASVAVGVAAVLWSQAPEYRTLYSSMSPDRASTVVETLDSLNIPYKLQPQTGAVMVPADQLHEARLKLAGSGITSEDGTGMEMLREEKGFGVSDFMQSKKYQHALETELARTIESMHQVRQARVHLAIPKQTVFVRDRKPPSASIMLDVFPGSLIEKQHVAAIVNLVASSINDLKAEEVTVVDQQGNLLSKIEQDDDLELTSRQFAYRQKVEHAYEDRIEQLLTPIAGAGKVQVQVSADIDFATEQESRESWNPERQVIRSEQINSETRSAADIAAGIPGALTNQPPGAQGEEGAAAQNALDSQSITRNYEIERVLYHTAHPGGLLRKLSVAVVLDNPRQSNEEGEVVSTPFPQEELDQLTLLVKDAVGIDEARGDRVTVISADFTGRDEGMQEIDEPGFWEEAWFASLLKQVLIGLAVLFIVLGILRPTIRTLTNPPALGRYPGSGELPPGGETGTAEGATAALAGAGQGATAGQPGTQAMAALGGPTAAPNVEQQMEAARAAAQEDPRRVAQVVKKWVAEDAGQ